MSYHVSKQESPGQEYTLVRKIEGTSWSIWANHLPWGLYDVAFHSHDGEKMPHSVLRALECVHYGQTELLFAHNAKHMTLGPNDDLDSYYASAHFGPDSISMEVIEVAPWVQLASILFRLADKVGDPEVPKLCQRGSIF